RPKDDGLRHEFMHRRLALGLAAGVTGRGVLARANRRYVNEARNAGFFDCFGDGARTPRLNISECLIVTFSQDTDEIDCGVGALERGWDRLRLAQISLNQVDLARLA